METEDLSQLPKASVLDHMHLVVKAGISAIPAIGGPAAELFAALIAPPLSKRRDEWLQSVAVALVELQAKVNEFDLAALQENENFVSILLQATQVALRNHQDEKLNALRNAVLNAAVDIEIDDSIQAMFMTFVDRFTPMHLLLLKLLQDPREWGRQHGIAYPNWSSGGLSSVIDVAIPDFRNRGDVYQQLGKELFASGLTNTESFGTMMTVEGMLSGRTTSLGNHFLRYIEEPQPKSK